MEIKTDFPYYVCESCTDCILYVDEIITRYQNKPTKKALIVRCRNENLCKRLKGVVQDAPSDRE